MEEKMQRLKSLASETEGARSDHRWYAVQSQPRREALAAAQLTQQGFPAFLPRQAKTVRHARKIRTILAPAFSSYLFVSFDVGRDRWRSVNGTYGVSRLVMFHDRPAPLPQGVVETLIASTDEKGCLGFEDGLRVGQTVRLTAGPFADTLGTLARLNGPERVDLLMRLLNGEVVLNVRREWVAPILQC